MNRKSVPGRGCAPEPKAEFVLRVEGGDERALVIQVASRRAAEQGLSCLPVAGEQLGPGATADLSRGVRDLAEFLPCPLDLRRRPGQGARHPLVIDLRAGLVQQDVLNPVSTWPSGVGTVLQPHAPRDRAARRHAAGQPHQLRPGQVRCGQLGQVTGRQVSRVIPDDALQRRLDDDRVIVAGARRPGGLHQLPPAGPVLAGEPGRRQGGVQGNQRSGGRVLAKLPRRGQHRQVRRIPVLQVARQDRAGVTRPRIIHLDAVLLLEAADHGQETALLISGPRTEDGHRAGGRRATAARQRERRHQHEHNHYTGTVHALVRVTAIPGIHSGGARVRNSQAPRSPRRARGRRWAGHQCFPRRSGRHPARFPPAE